MKVDWPTGGNAMRSALWKIRSGLQRLTQGEDGQSLVEYALVILLIAIALVAAVKNFATALVGYYQYIISSWPH
ncbi:MAG: hypothetical protein ABSB60_13540 [Terracidiphilus sp.]